MRRASASSPIVFTSVKRIAMTLGLPASTSEVELVRFWRDYMREAPVIPPKEVNTGAAVREQSLPARRSIS